jgi:hypothetical protein
LLFVITILFIFHITYHIFLLTLLICIGRKLSLKFYSCSKYCRYVSWVFFHHLFSPSALTVEKLIEGKLDHLIEVDEAEEVEVDHLEETENVTENVNANASERESERGSENVTARKKGIVTVTVIVTENENESATETGDPIETAALENEVLVTLQIRTKRRLKKGTVMHRKTDQ